MRLVREVLAEREEEFILISPATPSGENFMKTVQARGLPFAALVNSETERTRLEQSGISPVIVTDTTGRGSNHPPELPIGKVFLFERSLPLTCRYLQICRLWTSRPIFVIKTGSHPWLIYKSLGADYVIHTNGDDVSFLIARHL